MVGFSKQWEAVYSSGAQLSSWPWTDVVSLVNRHAKPTEPGLKVLELGCGVGANIPFLLSLGFDYYSVEGSSAAVELLHQRFPNLQSHIVQGDFSKDLIFKGPFDLILDRASLTCNSTDSISRTIASIKDLLSPHGKFIGIDWYSTEHSAFLMNSEAVDPFTRFDISSSQFAGLGAIHFSSESHLKELFTDFKFISLEHVKRTQLIGPNSETRAAFNFVVER